MISRAHLITVLAGLIAPHLLVELLALFVIHVWFPMSKYMWTNHGIAMGRLAIDIAAVFDVLLAVLAGFGIAFGVARVFRCKPVSQWLIFVGAFLVSLVVPTIFDREYSALMWFLAQPLNAAFLLAAALGFWLPSRSRGPAHVA